MNNIDTKQIESQLLPCPVCGATDIGLYGPSETQDGEIVWDIFCDGKYDQGEPCAYVAGYTEAEKAMNDWNNRLNLYNYGVIEEK